MKNIVIAFFICTMVCLGQTGKIAITIDDVPRGDTAFFSAEKRTVKLLEGIKTSKVPGVLFFVRTSGLNEKTEKRILAYTGAGYHIANHSHSHQWPGKVGADFYIGDVFRAHQILQKMDGFLPFFRYPLLREGKTIEDRDKIRDALKSMGYQNGYVTVDNYDWYMDVLLQNAVKEKKQIHFNKLKRVYVNSLWKSILFYDGIARRILGRSPSHVLLLHENDLAALFIEDLVAHIRSQGWTIISPQEAYRDPIASDIPDTLFNNQGRVAAIAHSKGMAKKDLVHVSEDKEYLDILFKKKGVFE